MTTFLLRLPLLLCMALPARSATVVPAVSVQEGPVISELNTTTVVPSEQAAGGPQVRLSFCLDGWHSFRGNCYLLVNDPDSWGSAESTCADFEGSLASAHSRLEYSFLQRLAKTGGHPFAWMGGFFFQGAWRWEDGSRFDYNNWDSVTSTSRYQCLQLNSEGNNGWSNHGCDMLFPFICQLSSDC